MMFKPTFTLLAACAGLFASLSAFGQYNPNVQNNPNIQNFQNTQNILDAQNIQLQQNLQYQQSTQNAQSEQNRQSAQSALSGYTNDGTLFMGGQRIGNPHQILHDAQIPSFMTITANRYTYTDNPNHGQGSLVQMEAATTAGSGADLLLNRLYLSPNNPYVGLPAGPYPNLQTYKDILVDAKAKGYLLTNADDGKTYAFKTLSASSKQAETILIRELPNTAQFRAAADPLGGAVGVRVTQNGDAAALAAYLATVKPYDFSWQPNYGSYSGFGANDLKGWGNSGSYNYNTEQAYEQMMQLLMQAAMQQNNYVGSQTGVNQVEFFPRECGVTRTCGSDTTITVSGNRVVKGANYAHGEVQIRSGYSASTVEGQAGPFVPGNRNLLLQYHSNGFNDGKAFTFNITSPDDRTLNQLGIDITRSAESYQNNIPYAIPYKGDFNTLSGGFNSGSLLAGSLLAAGISPQVIQ
jgi:hypothetical protein